MALRPKVGHGLLILEVFQITHNDAAQSVGLLRTSDQLVAETSTLQHTTLTTENTSMPPGGIRTHDLSRRTATDLRLRPRDYQDRRIKITPTLLWNMAGVRISKAEGNSSVTQCNILQSDMLSALQNMESLFRLNAEYAIPKFWPPFASEKNKKLTF